MTPSTARELFDKGTEYFENENWDLAFAHFSRVIDLDNDNSMAWHRRGEAHHLKGQFRNAISYLTNAAKINPNYAPTWFVRGHAYSDSGNDQQAFADNNSALTIDPAFARAWHVRGAFNDRAGHVKLALSDYETAISLDPVFAPTWNNRGSIYLRAGMWKEALKDFDQALALDPNYTAARDNRKAALGKRPIRRILDVVLLNGIRLGAVVLAPFIVPIGVLIYALTGNADKSEWEKKEDRQRAVERNTRGNKQREMERQLKDIRKKR